MKDLHLVLILTISAIVIVGVISAFFLFKAEPEKVMMNALNAQASLTKYRVSYNLSYSVKAGGIDINANGAMDVMKNSNITKVLMSIESLGEKMRIEQYQTPNGIIQCAKSLLNTTCEKTNSTMPIQTPEEQAETLRKMIDEKAVTMSFIGTKNIIGRTCDGISSTYNMDKQNIPMDVQNLKEARLDMCLDKTNGLPLEVMIIMKMDSGTEKGEMKISMTATELSLDVPEIVVPAII